MSSQPPSKNPESPLEPLRVLFVEDSEADMQLLCIELKRGGYDVAAQRVSTRLEFLSALLAPESWDLIISDYAMPQFDGLKAFGLYNEVHCDVPFIFVSGAMGEERAVQAMQAGARDYILKDQLGRLNAAVRRELDEAASRRQRRAAEAAKDREQGRLAVALQATGAGIFEYSIPADTTGYCNERFAEIFGLSADELPSYDKLPYWLVEQVHPDERQRVTDLHHSFVIGRSREFAVECRVRHTDGTWRDVTCVANAARRHPDGTVSDLVGVVLDRTREKHMEIQFRQAQKMEAIGQLAGGIAHDFNNLLTVISSFGEFVLDRLESGTEVHADMLEILQATERAEKLTSQLLAYARRRPVKAKVLDVNEQVTAVEGMLRRLIGESVAFETTLASDLWSTRIDAGGLEQVLVNLSINARDAMEDGGRLSIKTANATIGADYLRTRGIDLPAGDYVTITVSDTGAGMDEETMARLFEPFFTTKPIGKGTGLGLATCYGIVKQAGGAIWASSEPGRGTTFNILLPSVPDDVTIDRALRPPSGLRGSETVLVVEDDAPVRSIVVRQLRTLGYDVLEAANAAEALAMARERQAPVHALVTDMVMPETHGPELAAQLLAIYPALRTVYISGYARDTIESDDAVTLVQKPFSRDSLAGKLREVLDR